MDKEISERIVYLKEVAHQEKLLEKVKKFLKKKKKDWFFLGDPKKFDDGTWHFWLNPCEQNIYESGWYTLEELKQWGDEKGPIIKQK